MAKRQASLLSFVSKPSKRSNSEPNQSLVTASAEDNSQSLESNVTQSAAASSSTFSPPSPSLPPTTTTTSTTITTTLVVNTGPASLPSASSSQALPRDIAKTKNDKPAQPEDAVVYPSHTSGNVKRSFQPSWYSLYPWMEYSVERDCVFCFPCRFFG
ncbi:PREDICTED: putative protein TPRXL, partial [Amphimedon queenslandica]|uniref:TTF-type domain-containing protein n=1 Tax=Amphimedon queenslandica TaxID=400682 RepID=A0AAN0IU88_AMPQE